MGLEQRVHRRVRPHPGKPVQIQIIGSDFLDVLVPIDVSEGGVGLRVSHRFEGCTVNVVLDFIVKLPSVRAFQVQGMIRHIRDEPNGGGMFGAEFVNLRHEHQELLRAYIDERSDLKVKLRSG
jgi:PilZ domain